jgi:hypothetical protein
MELTRAIQRRTRILAMLVAPMIICTAFASNAQDMQPPRELTFKDGFGSRKGDDQTYVLTGCCWIRGIRFGDPDRFVSEWIAQHPLATITPVSKMPIMSDKLVYVWIADRDSSLNVDLVRAGIYPGAAMADMLDNDRGLTELLKNPKLADARAVVEKERAQKPRAGPERLESEDEYNHQMDQIKTAETEARRQKMGVWSDSMKEERESLGIP